MLSPCRLNEFQRAEPVTGVRTPTKGSRAMATTLSSPTVCSDEEDVSLSANRRVAAVDVDSGTSKKSMEQWQDDRRKARMVAATHIRALRKATDAEHKKIKIPNKNMRKVSSITNAMKALPPPIKEAPSAATGSATAIRAKTSKHRSLGKEARAKPEQSSVGDNAPSVDQSRDKNESGGESKETAALGDGAPAVVDAEEEDPPDLPASGRGKRIVPMVWLGGAMNWLNRPRTLGDTETSGDQNDDNEGDDVALIPGNTEQSKVPTETCHVLADVPTTRPSRRHSCLGISAEHTTSCNPSGSDDISKEVAVTTPSRTTARAYVLVDGSLSARSEHVPRVTLDESPRRRVVSPKMDSAKTKARSSASSSGPSLDSRSEHVVRVTRTVEGQSGAVLLDTHKSPNRARAKIVMVASSSTTPTRSRNSLSSASEHSPRRKVDSSRVGRRYAKPSIDESTSRSSRTRHKGDRSALDVQSEHVSTSRRRQNERCVDPSNETRTAKGERDASVTSTETSGTDETQHSKGSTNAQGATKAAAAHQMESPRLVRRGYGHRRSSM